MDRSSSMSNSLSQIFLGVTQNFDLWPHQHGQEHNPARILPHGPMVAGSEKSAGMDRAERTGTPRVDKK